MIERGSFRLSHCHFDNRNLQEIFRHNTLYAGKTIDVGWCSESALWYFAQIAGNGAARADLCALALAGRKLALSSAYR
jgi:hypothetical protein